MARSSFYSDSAGTPCSGGFSRQSWVPSPRRGPPLQRMFFQPILDRVHQRTAAVAVDRCDGEHRARPAIGVDKCSDALLALVGFDKVEFVQHQPPWFVEKRRVI